MRQLSFTFNHTSPIQSHTWIELNPHSYLLTFWAWSNIVAFREMSWSSSTLVIHYARSSIMSVKSGSPEALHPPEKKRKRDKSEWAYNLTRAKKKRTKGKDGEAKIKHHSKDIHPSHTCTWPSSKVTWPLKRQDFWSCKINEEDMQLYPYLELHKSLSKSRRGFSNYLSEIQIQKRD